ncbi:MAG: hypothetical protein ACFFD4_11600 [Candidatus Odinarchaeota archaeon]
MIDPIVVLSYVIAAAIYSVFTFLAFLRLKERQTRLSFTYFLLCLTTVFICFSALGEYLFAISGDINNPFLELAVLTLMYEAFILYSTFFILANLFVLKWPQWTDWVIILLYTMTSMLLTLGLNAGFGWVVYEEPYETLYLDPVIDASINILSTLLIIALAGKFFTTSRKISDPEKLEDRRALQLLAAGYFTATVPFILLTILYVFPEELYQDLNWSLSLISLITPIATYIFIYFGLYRPNWFKRRYEKKAWIASVFE